MNDYELNLRELTGDDALRFARESGMLRMVGSPDFTAGVGDLIRFARLVRAGWTPPRGAALPPVQRVPAHELADWRRLSRPSEPADGVAWVASTADVSDKDAMQSVLTGRSLDEIRADVAKLRADLADGVPAVDPIRTALERAQALGEMEMDWLGTGSNQKHADKEQRDYLAIIKAGLDALGVAASEPLAWEFTGPGGLKRFLTQRQYDAQTPATQKWYRPICPKCDPGGVAVPQEGQPE